MTCKICGDLVIWRGPIGRLEFTECIQCHAVNCQLEAIEADEAMVITPEESEVYETIWGSFDLGGEA